MKNHIYSYVHHHCLESHVGISYTESLPLLEESSLSQAIKELLLAIYSSAEKQSELRMEKKVSVSHPMVHGSQF